MGRPHPKAVLSACCAAIVTTSFGLAAPALCMPAMARELGLDYARQGLGFRAPTWSLLASPAAARLADRIGFRRVVVFASAVQAGTGDRFPQAGATMFSVLSASGAFGCAAAPVVVGWIAEADGTLPPALAALAVAPAVILAICARRATIDRPVGPVLGRPEHPSKSDAELNCDGPPDGPAS